MSMPGHWFLLGFVVGFLVFAIGWKGESEVGGFVVGFLVFVIAWKGEIEVGEFVVGFLVFCDCLEGRGRERGMSPSMR